MRRKEAGIPELDPQRAGAIVAYRQLNGRSATLEELTKVTGMDPGALAKTRHLITL